MKKFSVCAAILLTALSGFAQGVRVQWATTNTGTVVTNIVRILSSNLLPNRLSATNPTISALRVYAATNQNQSGFWLDPTTITPGAATNVNDVAAGPGVTVATNGLLRTIIVTNVSGTFTGNAAGLTNYGGPEILLNPIRVGFGTQPYPRTLKTSDFFLLGNPGTAGIGRHLTFQPDVSAGTQDFLGQMRNVNLQIFPDCGSFTNNASLTNPAVNIPLADIYGNRFRFATNGEWAIQRSSLFMDSQDMSTNLIYGGPIHLLWFYLPIPYSNGCVVRLQHTVGNTNWNHGYIGAAVDSQPNTDQLGRFGTYRLRSKNTSGAFTGGSASNFLFSITTSGYLVGWMQGAFDNTGDGITGNANVAAFLDSRGLQIYSGSGETWMYYTDDTFGSTYAGGAGIFIGQRAGVVNSWFGPNNNAMFQAIEGYRWFDNDGAYWTNSAIISLSGASVFPSLVGYSSTILYYGP